MVLASAGAASATTWHDGDMVSYSATSWGRTSGNATALLLDNYDTVYANTPPGPSLLEVGISGQILRRAGDPAAPAGFSMLFSNSLAIVDYLPPNEPPGILDADLLDPTSSSSGAFGGNVLAMRLNIDFSDAGVLVGTSGLHFGDLLLSNFDSPDDSHFLPALPLLDGLSLRQFEAMMETILGSGSAPLPYSVGDLDLVTQYVNDAFEVGLVTQFAQDHLDAPVPEPGTLLLLGSGIAGLVLFGRTKRG